MFVIPGSSTSAFGPEAASVVFGATLTGPAPRARPVNVTVPATIESDPSMLSPPIVVSRSIVTVTPAGITASSRVAGTRPSDQLSGFDQAPEAPMKRLTCVIASHEAGSSTPYGRARATCLVASWLPPTSRIDGASMVTL